MLEANARSRWLAAWAGACIVAALWATPSSPQSAEEEEEVQADAGQGTAPEAATPAPDATHAAPAADARGTTAGEPEAIAYMFHGSYMNAMGQEIAHPSQAMIDAYRKASGTTTRDASFVPRMHADYCAACLAEGVPEPPAFDSGLWVSKGSVAAEFTSQPVLEIFVYESEDPPGVCVALPRGTAGSINLLGVICQGEETGRACFWDNVSNSGDLYADGPRITHATIEEFSVAEFRNGDQLFEDCTNCHRGQNVFLVHDELFEIPRRVPRERYQPIPTGPNVGNETWGNPGRRRDDDPDELNLMRAEGCGKGYCHASLPSMSKAYCGSVLRPAIERGKMPMGGFSDTDVDDLVCRDFCLLQEECRLLGAGAGMQDAKTLCSCASRWPGVADIAAPNPD